MSIEELADVDTGVLDRVGELVHQDGHHPGFIEWETVIDDHDGLVVGRVEGRHLAGARAARAGGREIGRGQSPQRPYAVPRVEHLLGLGREGLLVLLLEHDGVFLETFAP